MEKGGKLRCTHIYTESPFKAGISYPNTNLCFLSPFFPLCRVYWLFCFAAIIYQNQNLYLTVTKFILLYFFLFIKFFYLDSLSGEFILYYTGIFGCHSRSPRHVWRPRKESLFFRVLKISIFCEIQIFKTTYRICVNKSSRILLQINPSS